MREKKRRIGRNNGRSAERMRRRDERTRGNGRRRRNRERRKKIHSETKIVEILEKQ